MQVVDTIKKSAYIYSSTTKWGLKRYTCDVAYYTEEPLDDLYYVICSIISTNDGHYDKRSLGVLLGFSVINHETAGRTDMYYDEAEVRMFDDILSKLVDEHLIYINETEHEIVLTKLGVISLRENKHYQFYVGTKDVYEHTMIDTETPTALLMFPFFKDMGIYTEIKTTKKIWPIDEMIEDAVFCKSNQLIRRLELQSNEDIHIYSASIQEYFEVEIRNIPVSLYQLGDGYLPVVMKSDEVAIKATELIWSPLNALRKENIILECLFQKLWDDKNSILNYNSLEPFLELVDYEELTKDSRTVWSDSKLFDIITKNANQTSWRNITRNCDISIIQDNVDKFKENIDWPIFTGRVENDFLISTFIKYPWDLEVLSEDLTRPENVIENLLIQQKKTNEDWNWEELGNRLSEEFVLSNLDILQVDLTRFTSDSDKGKNTILAHPDKSWDWNKIDESFDLEFILDNIATIGQNLPYKKLFDRIFTNEEWTNLFVRNNDFQRVLSVVCKGDGALSKQLYNDKSYVWTSESIDLFMKNGLLCWESTPYSKGFECNPSLIWDQDFFSRYSKYVSTEEGLEFLSKKVSDVNIILTSPQFNWHWDSVSANAEVLTDNRLYTNFGDKLNWSIVFESYKNNNFFESISNIDTLIGVDEHAWSLFSAIANTDYVKQNYTFSWDWQVLTERMFSKLKLENIGNKKFIDKWDWNYLSLNVNEDFLLTNLSLYSAYWNWEIVFHRIFNDENRFNEAFIDKIADILTNIPGKEKCTKAWHEFTIQYSFDELKSLIMSTLRKRNYWWDISYFCRQPEFNIFRDLDECRIFVDWEALSSSSAVDQSFKFNPKLRIKEKAWDDDIKKLLSDSRNKWNFYLLSHFVSLRDKKWFLMQFRDKVDWDYISEYSKVFAESDKQSLNVIIESFKQNINFTILSERSDVNIEQVLKINPTADYNYNSLIQRNVVDATLDLVESKPDYNWDWQLISSSKSFLPTASFLVENISNDFNWKCLSQINNPKIWGSENLILSVLQREDISSQIDWQVLSSYDCFPLTKEILLHAPVEQLNWKTLSSRKSIIKHLNDYRTYVDWRIISDNKYFVPNAENMRTYKGAIVWSIFCRRQDFVFSNEVIEEFGDYIDWDIASSSTNILFTKSLVEKYQDKWNWPVLVKNKAFHNKIRVSELPFVRQLNVVNFIKQFPCRPRAYHFTHMSNAVKIIREMKLQSRNYAEGKFSNSAGKNVERTDKAHKFARFYFAPKSPTQFYNECLGKDHTDRRYYERANKNGLPKCPLPVFFVFDIEELLMSIPDKCFYSTGNMQKDATKFFRIIETPDRIKAREIYIKSIDTFNERQQEFLVEGELDFSKLNFVRICCFDRYQASLLKKELQGTRWENIVDVDMSLYERCNKQLYFDDESDIVHISTNYQNPFQFRVSYTNEVPSIINKAEVVRQRGNNIYVDNNIEIKKDTPFEIYFEVDSPRAGSWLIYKNEIS